MFAFVSFSPCLLLSFPAHDFARVFSVKAGAWIDLSLSLSLKLCVIHASVRLNPENLLSLCRVLFSNITRLSNILSSLILFIPYKS